MLSKKKLNNKIVCKLRLGVFLSTLTVSGVLYNYYEYRFAREF